MEVQAAVQTLLAATRLAATLLAATLLAAGWRRQMIFVKGKWKTP
jgi:hypothetical protein